MTPELIVTSRRGAAKHLPVFVALSGPATGRLIETSDCQPTLSIQSIGPSDHSQPSFFSGPEQIPKPIGFAQVGGHEMRHILSLVAVLAFFLNAGCTHPPKRDQPPETPSLPPPPDAKPVQKPRFVGPNNGNQA